MGPLPGPGEDGSHRVVGVAVVTEPILPRSPPEEFMCRSPFFNVPENGLDGLGVEPAPELAELMGIAESGWLAE